MGFAGGEFSARSVVHWLCSLPLGCASFWFLRCTDAHFLSVPLQVVFALEAAVADGAGKGALVGVGAHVAGEAAAIWEPLPTHVAVMALLCRRTRHLNLTLPRGAPTRYQAPNLQHQKTPRFGILACQDTVDDGFAGDGRHRTQ